MGRYLRFVDADDTTQLAHEIEKWDEAGTSSVWVKVPQIDASSTTDFIWMYYGNASAADGQNASGVWSNGYVAVWHLKEDPSGTAPQMKDSTTNALHGSSLGTMTAAAQVVGQVDGSLSFDNVDDGVDVPNTGSLFNLTSAWTVEAWAKPAAAGSSGVNDPIIWKIDTNGLNGDTFGLGWGLGDDFSTKLERASDDADFGVNSAAHTVNQWHYAVGVYDGATLSIHVNGAQEGSSAIGAVTAYTGTAPLRIGNLLHSNHGAKGVFDGLIDEARVSNIARSTAWISAQYKSMTDTLASYSSEERGNLRFEGLRLESLKLD